MEIFHNWKCLRKWQMQLIEVLFPNNNKRSQKRAKSFSFKNADLNQYIFSNFYRLGVVSSCFLQAFKSIVSVCISKSNSFRVEPGLLSISTWNDKLWSSFSRPLLKWKSINLELVILGQSPLSPYTHSHRGEQGNFQTREGKKKLESYFSITPLQLW